MPERVSEGQRGAPRMTNQNRPFDVELIERCTEELRLDFDGDVAVIRPVAVAVARTIERNRLITCRERAVQPGSILTGAGIAVNQNHRTA